MVDVSIVKCQDYKHSDSCVKHAIDLIGGIKSFVKPGDKVLLKVNLLLPAKPEAAITTHPKIVEAVIQLIKSQNAEPWVGDSSGGQGITMEAFEVSGIKAVCEKYNARIINFDTSKVHKIEIPNGKIINEIHVTSALFDADCVICMPKLKTHALTLYTGAIKNLYGTIPGGRKSLIHAICGKDVNKFAEALVDIYSQLPIHLNLMDGIVGMEGIGPNHGKPIKSGVILAGSRALELDAVSSSLMGFNPYDIPMLKIAQDRGLGTIDIDKISILGERLEDVKIDFKKPLRIYKGIRFLPSFLINLFLESPKLPYPNKAGCTQCKICEESCPVDAIRVTDAPEFEYDKCIRCYCCYELCPEDGVKLKKALLPRS
jgi:uncharacterized protein (DUF362 family)/NAD-dependent dihydropyrimidine dehydrogenase PreA subunit